MKTHIHLPDAEFAMMQVIWSLPAPVSKTRATEAADPLKGWKQQTVYTMLNRLTAKGYLSTEKRGKERYYSPLITREEYLNGETERFMKQLHKNSLTGLMNALYADAVPDENDLDELERWLGEQRRQ